MKKKTHAEDSRSIKTFLIYAAIVFFFILLSLAIKVVFVFQQSKFDDKQSFNIAIIQNNTVKEIVGFNPSENTYSLLQLEGAPLRPDSLGKMLGIIPDAQLQIPSDIATDSDIAGTLQASLWHMSSIKTKLTFFDVFRLLLFTKHVSTGNRMIETLKLPQDEAAVDSVVGELFLDHSISSENTSIQIINASDTPGIGKRLERVLVNMGANVVAVSTAQKKQSHSQIRYLGSETYTLNRIKKFLPFAVSKLHQETIANIVIIIGEDTSNTEQF